jgi:hypothetical protein
MVGTPKYRGAPAGTDLILAKLTQGPAVMIRQTPPPLRRSPITLDDRVACSDHEYADVEQAHPRYAAKNLNLNVKISEI